MTHLVESQDAALAFLADPASHGGSEVKRIDTHAAVVFLTRERALKVKRAVRFPFLDYSTLARRKAACEAEIEANRAFAQELYRRTVAVTREHDGRLVLDGSGEPVEWAVEMARFDEMRTLDRVAERGGIGLELADTLARVVVAAHARAPVVDAGPWIAALAAFIDQNAAAFAEAPALFPAPYAERLTRDSRAALARVRPLLKQRGVNGLVRRGHGDLHLGNIAMIDGEPVPFDAVEFDPLIAAGDVLYDLAFLLMDLLERSLAEAASVVLNRYLVESRRLEKRHREERSDTFPRVDERSPRREDYLAIQSRGCGPGSLRFARDDGDSLDGLAALPLFLSLRAAIRAKVTAARREFMPPAEHARIEKSATTYFDLARALIAPPSPRLVAVGGLSGTGKSDLARRLAAHLPPAPGAVVLRSDVERKIMLATAETERLPPDAYAKDVTARVYARLVEKARRALAAGHSVIVDAVFAREGERAEIAATAQACAAPFCGVFLHADLPTRIDRIGGRARDASDADAEVAQRQQQYDIGTLSWHLVDAAGPLDSVLATVTALLARTAPTSHAPGSASQDKTAGCAPAPPRA